VNDAIIGLDPLPFPAEPISQHPAQTSKRELRGGKPADGDLDTLIARQAAAEIEREEGYDRCAIARLAGAYDGDAEHRIALAAIRRLRDSMPKLSERVA